MLAEEKPNGLRLSRLLGGKVSIFPNLQA